MPFNLTIGSTGVITAIFTDANGNLVVPSSATLTITYAPSSNSLTTVSTTIGMTQSGSFFTGSWPTAVAAAGLATVAVTAPGQSSALTAQLRLH